MLYRIGDIYAERSERGAADMELLSVTMNGGVMQRSEIEGKDNSSEDKSNYKVVRKGDMVYNSMRMWQGANGVSSYDGICTFSCDNFTTAPEPEPLQTSSVSPLYA